jgi:hypothetical protein
LPISHCNYLRRDSVLNVNFLVILCTALLKVCVKDIGLNVLSFNEYRPTVRAN